MNEKKLIIIGAGSLGMMTLDAALEMDKYQEICFIDDNIKENSTILGYKVIGGLDTLNKHTDDYDFIIAIANNKIRQTVVEDYPKLKYVNIIHPKTSISRFSQIKGKGNIVLPHSSIDPNVTIKNHVIINKNNSIGHDSVLDDFTQVSPGCCFGGFTSLSKGVFVGMNATTVPKVSIGDFSVIGAGAVVTKDIPSNATAVGVPAKVIKER